MFNVVTMSQQSFDNLLSVSSVITYLKQLFSILFLFFFVAWTSHPVPSAIKHVGSCSWVNILKNNITTSHGRDVTIWDPSLGQHCSFMLTDSTNIKTNFPLSYKFGNVAQLLNRSLSSMVLCEVFKELNQSPQTATVQIICGLNTENAKIDSVWF